MTSRWDAGGLYPVSCTYMGRVKGRTEMVDNTLSMLLVVFQDHHSRRRIHFRRYALICTTGAVRVCWLFDHCASLM